MGIAFRDPSLLEEAMTHSSYANEYPSLGRRDNERLEYLGDAVLQLITAEYLYKIRPSAHEGELTQTRSAMVNTNTLASLSAELDLGAHLFLGKGVARTGGRGQRSLLANAFEATLGAIFLDAGYDAAYHFYLGRFRALPAPVQDENFKGRLQQVVQERYGTTPYYDIVASQGPGHRREYLAVVYAGSEPLGKGNGGTKQAAEQESARDALAQLGVA
ncbi:MAG TPA: ribonuclease III [Candidatus Dormibacteraeota bacterium]|nr:ribonuclease III [Candidatus Dormibacteraeota bacterium]